jgi:hypothetical protein
MNVAYFGLNKGAPVLPVSIFLGARFSRRPSAVKGEVGGRGRGGERRRQDLGPARVEDTVELREESAAISTGLRLQILGKSLGLRRTMAGAAIAIAF